MDLPTEKAGVSGGTPVVRTAVSDITERKKAEEELRKSEERFRALAEITSDMIWEVGNNGVYTYINQKIKSSMGYDPSEMIGKKTPFDVMTPEDKVRVGEIFRAIAESRKPFANLENWNLHKDGRKVLLETSGVPLFDSQGQYAGYRGIARDITERKKGERELQEKNAELEHFIYTISHDLKSPLVTVKTFLGYLEQDLPGSDTERIKKDMLYMHSAADKMGQLLDELLKMSRIGRIANQPVRVTFRELVEEALNMVAGPIAERGVKVQLRDAPVALTGDRPRLVEIWQNLVENAVKFMGDQASAQIEIGVERRGGDRVFFVRDNGMGIDPRHQVKVFSLFEKIDSKSEGAGLGLALVKRIVELYQGTIWLESKGLSQGACFLFTLPGAVKDTNQEEGEKS